MIQKAIFAVINREKQFFYRLTVSTCWKPAYIYYDEIDIIGLNEAQKETLRLREKLLVKLEDDGFGAIYDLHRKHTKE